LRGEADKRVSRAEGRERPGVDKSVSLIAISDRELGSAGRGVVYFDQGIFENREACVTVIASEAVLGIDVAVDRPGVGDAHVLKREESGSFNRAATSAICKFTIRALQKCIRRQVRPHSLKARVIFNVAPTELDIYPTTSWDKDALVQPQSRAAYARLLK
jgi:hypothetical protein